MIKTEDFERKLDNLFKDCTAFCILYVPKNQFKDMHLYGKGFCKHAIKEISEQLLEKSEAMREKC